MNAVGSAGLTAARELQRYGASGPISDESWIMAFGLMAVILIICFLVLRGVTK